ncbi:hypothetical protein GCM10018781_63450 [Kitasatospora indigofera]|uniref:Uncharacterized protein n=2 Tax=Kitasatospora indigofera TaxID=67307 RepID=A0A919GC51_9ACTN|nr:hypothetical protein GCM10018781_63450 [Kitasatospora indigofera]
MGEQLIDDWCSYKRIPAGERKRDAELQHLGTRIRQMFGAYEAGFAEYLNDHGEEAGDGGRRDVKALLDCDFSDEPGDEGGKLLLQEFFQFVGQSKAQDLCRAYRFRRIPGGTVSRVALRLMLVWAPARRCWTRATRRDLARREPDSAKEWKAPCELKYARVYRNSHLAKVRKSTSKVLAKISGREWQWPMTVEHINREIRIAWFSGMPLLRRSPWHDFYYAACIFAIGLLPLERGRLCNPEEISESGDRNDFTASLAGEAVDFLDRACRRADSSSIASMRSWIVAEDPDLAGLRTFTEFVDWEDEHYPIKNPAYLRPVDVHGLELTRYQHHLVEKVAGLMVQIWERRECELLSTHPHADGMLQRWIDEENSTWTMARAFVVDRHHWQTRFDFIRTMQEFAQINSFLFEYPCPSYSDDPVMQLGESFRRRQGADDSHQLFQDTVSSVHEHRKERMGDLGELLGTERNLKEQICITEPKASSQKDIRRLCIERSRMWARLEKAFSERPGEDTVEVLGDLASVFEEPGRK